MKKIFKRFTLAALCVLLSTIMLSACSGNTGGSTADGSSSGGAREKLTVGTYAAFPPFEYTTTNGLVGEFDGIDIAIAKKIADDNGMDLEISNIEFSGLIAAINSGKIDMAIAGMTVNDERKQNVDFSVPYYVAEQVIVVADGNTDITDAQSLKNGKKVGVVMGYTADSIVTNDLAIDEANIVRANRGIDIVQDVKNGKLDAVVIDSYTGKQLAEKNGLKVVEDKESFTAEEYAIAVQKGNTELLDKINNVLNEMLESGQIDELAAQYSEVEAQ